MSKLVLFMPDGTTLDVPLARERTTIGRRADNDICLPNLAVSGEHAVVVTILADSFLEDLGSTNGTLVNGKPIAKHFLRDRDQIDIGRHKLVYCVDEDVVLEPDLPVGMARLADRDFGAQVETARPFVRGRRAAAAPGQVIQEDEDRADSAPEPAVPADAREAERPAPAPAPAPPPQGPSLKLLSGVNAGAAVALTKAETTLGRPGVQVALIVDEGGAFRLRPVEGISPPTVNGRAIPADGVALTPSDVIEIAGTRLEFVDPRSQTTKQDVAA